MMRPLPRSLGACDFANPSAPSVNLMNFASQQTAAATQQLAQQAAHQKALQQQRAYTSGIQAVTAEWAKLPVGPYPPASDTSGFPRTGDPTLVLDRSSITQAALAEPGRVSANLLAQAKARTPKLSPLFWVGIACLGAGIYVSRNR